MDQLEISFGTPLRIILTEEKPQPSSTLTVTDKQTSITLKGNAMYTMPILYAVGLQVKYVDAGGNPARVDGEVEWASSDPAVVTIQPDTQDTSKCGIASTDNVGTAQVTATADADLGSGVRELITILDVTVVAGEAVAGTIAPVGSAEPIGPAPQR